MEASIYHLTPKWLRILYIAGVLLSVIGVLDPLEGSIMLVSGAILVTVSTYYLKDRYWKMFLSTAIMMAVGVFFLFFFSSLGGFPPLSWWWALLILPYPIGWLMLITLLIVRAVTLKKERSHAMPKSQ